MKKGLMLFIFFLGLAQLSAAQDFIELSSEIEKVTVFLNQAQIKRTASKFLPEGTHTLVISNLSPNIDPASIQVSGKGAFTILDYKHQYDYINPVKLNPEIKPLQDSLNYYKQALKLAEKMKFVYDSEQQMILNNQQVNNDSGFDIEDLDDLADYYRTRLSDIARKTIENENKINYLNRRISALTNQLREHGWGSNQKRSKIMIEVASKIRTAAKIELSYNVYQAGWKPGYEIYIDEVGKPVKMNFIANVYQNTSEEWENVQLVLSTENPSQNKNIPDLKPVKVYIVEPATVSAYKGKGRGLAMERKAEQNTALLYDDEEKMLEDALTAADYTSHYETYTAFNYEIAIPFTVHSDGKSQKIPIRSAEIPALYQYLTIPSKVQKAFLIAKVGEWEKYSLQPGNARIYFQEMYVGQSYIDPSNPEDTLILSLGADDNIKISRKRDEEYRDRKIMGGNIKETFSYNIEVRNNKNISVHIEIKEALPLSTSDEVKVLVENKGNARYDEKTGFLTWQLALKPGEKQSVSYKYFIEYPKDKKIKIQ
ncbi:MAG: mucoidy inhibitor MuiA family protein [Bacteroidetes bacterium]|nr:MAG: mucoidy inhibitor MuiA family protein [Bacteroidota bacterium]